MYDTLYCDFHITPLGTITKLIRLNSLNIRKKIWWQSLTELNLFEAKKIKQQNDIHFVLLVLS